MEVSVKLFASLRRYRPDVPLGQALTCRLDRAATLADLIEGVLGLPPQEVAIILVNGQQRDRHEGLQVGDCVSLWPPVAGGAR